MDLSPLEYMMKCYPAIKEIEQMRKVIGRYGLTGKQQVGCVLLNLNEYMLVSELCTGTTCITVYYIILHMYLNLCKNKTWCTFHTNPTPRETEIHMSSSSWLIWVSPYNTQA